MKLVPQTLSLTENCSTCENKAQIHDHRLRLSFCYYDSEFTNKIRSTIEFVFLQQIWLCERNSFVYPIQLLRHCPCRLEQPCTCFMRIGWWNWMASKILATSSQLCASHSKRYRGSDKCGAVFRSIDNLSACFCMGRYLCLEPNLPVAVLWRSTCKPSRAPQNKVYKIRDCDFGVHSDDSLWRN